MDDKNPKNDGQKSVGDNPKKELTQPARRDFLATTAATIGALGIPPLASAAPSPRASTNAGKGQKPNFLFIMVDEMRYPPVYESSDLKAFRSKYLKTQNAGVKVLGALAGFRADVDHGGRHRFRDRPERQRVHRTADRRAVRRRHRQDLRG